jgi:transposase
MAQVRLRTVSPPERRKLHRMKAIRLNAVNQKHARVILLSSGRVGNQEIAKRVGCSAQWIRKLIHRFNEGGIPGIEWHSSDHARASRKFDESTLEKIIDIAVSSPKKLIGLTQWSLRKLREYLVCQGIVKSISVEWLRELLRLCEVRLRRTKTWKESNDPLFWEKFRRIQRLRHRRPKAGKRICIDEFGPLNLQPRHGTCLTKVGTKSVDRLRATFHRYGGVRHFLAFYDLETGRLEGRFYDRKRAPEFLDFLKWVRRRFRSAGTLHVILDNYGTHLSPSVVLWATAHRIKFYFTPTKASWLNPIECHFTELKKFTLENSDYQSHEEMEAVITSYLEWHNGDRDLALASCQSSSKYGNQSQTPAP